MTSRGTVTIRPAQPRQAWYVAAATGDVGRSLLSRRILGRPVVLFRTASGRVAALEDRCAHRGYPLSLGTLDGDVVTAGFHGWQYDSSGRCVRVPSQHNVPLDARVHSYPVYEDSEFVWVWTGTPSVAAVRRPPTGWIDPDRWRVVGGELEIAANATLILETFADATHLPFVDSGVSPPVLADAVPKLDVEVTELAVSFERVFPPAPIQAWHAAVTGLDVDGSYPQHEAGELVGPGIWADRWDVLDGSTTHALRFAQAVTPVDAGHSRLLWRVATDSGPSDDALLALHRVFAGYYANLAGVLAVVQEANDLDPSRPGVNVRADVAALHVRRIMRELAGEDV